VLEEVAGTTLDSVAGLDGLAKLDHAEQRAAVKAGVLPTVPAVDDAPAPEVTEPPAVVVQPAPVATPSSSIFAVFAANVGLLAENSSAQENCLRYGEEELINIARAAQDIAYMFGACGAPHVADAIRKLIGIPTVKWGALQDWLKTLPKRKQAEAMKA